VLGGRRRSETFDVGPSTAPLLDVLTRRLGSLTKELIVQPAGPGPWTAFYRGPSLIALARPSPTGGRSSLEVASPAIAWARTLTRADDLDDEDVAAALKLAVERAPTVTTRSFADATGGDVGGFGALLAVGTIVIGFLDWVIRTRRERATAKATSTQRELAILNAARREVGRRANAITLGCLGAILVGFVSLFVVAFVSAWLNSLGLTSLAAALWFVPLGVAVYVYWRVRRRFPYAPRPPFNTRKFVINTVLIVVAAAALIVVSLLTNR
jgi:ABC-type Fe3+ transport system permease subunit